MTMQTFLFQPETRWLALAAASLFTATLFFSVPRVEAASPEQWVYFGTYTGEKSKGIYASRFNTDTGKISAPELVAETPSPSFLVVHPNHQYLYAVNETDNFGGKKSGSTSAFKLDAKTGKLTLLNQQPTGGGWPCHVWTDSAGKNVLVANYASGNIASYPVKADGSLAEMKAFVQHSGKSVNPQRQEGPHAHGIYLDKADGFAYVPDLGLDQVLIYKFDAAKGSLTPHEPAFAKLAPGAGPRHFAFHPTERYAYVINELTSTMSVFEANVAKGTLKEVQTLSTLPPDFKGNTSTAEVFVHPSGKFLYGSNRGHNSIVVYTIDQATGKLTLVEFASTEGKVPRSFGIDPTGKWLLAANQESDTVVVFSIDQATGKLKGTGQTINVGKPVCVTFVPVK
jgi:6-phosphogluconolactonase